ncbi:hypothetical protein D2Q93_04335 [Alicyclobacillaceae bacterium I2511]|nr:hypothetical protein D2Q93_04335 [Alicyclobacillaceae bacterium I2511]
MVLFDIDEKGVLEVDALHGRMSFPENIEHSIPSWGIQSNPKLQVVLASFLHENCAERGHFSSFALEMKDIHPLNVPSQYVPYNGK